MKPSYRPVDVWYWSVRPKPQFIRLIVLPNMYFGGSSIGYLLLGEQKRLLNSVYNKSRANTTTKIGIFVKKPLLI